MCREGSSSERLRVNMNPCLILDSFGSSHDHVEQSVNGSVIVAGRLTSGWPFGVS